MKIAEKIENFIHYEDPGADTSQIASEDYQRQFASEGLRKADYIIADLKAKSSETDESLAEYCYLSIGGADGSEIEAVLTNTEIRHGILIEKSNAQETGSQETGSGLAIKH